MSDNEGHDSYRTIENRSFPHIFTSDNKSEEHVTKHVQSNSWPAFIISISSFIVRTSFNITDTHHSFLHNHHH